MRLLWMAKALLSFYWRHPWQTGFLLIGIITGVGLWSSVQIINQHAQSSYQQAESLLGAQASHWIRHRSDQGVDQALYISLRRDGFRPLFPVIELELSTASGSLIQIIATDLFALPGDSLDNDQASEDFSDTWLDFVQPPYRAWVPSALANELELGEGEPIQLRDGRLLPPALIQAQAQQGRRVLVDIGAAMELSGSNRFDYLAVGKITPQRLEQLRARLPNHLQLVENQQHLDLQQLTASLHSHLTAMSLLSFAVGLFIVFNAVRFSLWNRRATLLNLRLMGCEMRELTLLIVFEALVFSLLGALSGFFLGIIVAHALLPGLGASLQSLYNATIESELGFTHWTLLQAWGISLLGLLWALAWPLYQQLRRTTLDANRAEWMLEDELRGQRRLAILASFLGLGAWWAYDQIDSVSFGFVMLGMMLFAAALILPLLMALALRGLKILLPQRFWLVRWLVSDGWAQLPALRSASMALLLALTANLGVGTLVDSFRDAFVGWLEVRQSADIYLRSSKLDYAQLQQQGLEQKWLRDSHYRIGVNVRWQDQPARVRGVDRQATDSLVMPLSKWQGGSPEAGRQLWRERDDAVLINEQAHFLAGVELGDWVELETDTGVARFEVVGVFYDYGNPYFQFYLPRETVKSLWRYHHSLGIALWLDPSNSEALQQAKQSLRSRGLQPSDWISQGEIRDLSVGIFDRTFAITAAMNGLTMMVAAIALLVSLLAILQERLPQFAQWRALGVSQFEQTLLVATPLLIFCTLVWLLSMPLGALLSWVLIHKINIISFGWSMPLQWSYLPAIQLAVIVLLICGTSLLLLAYQWRRQMPQALAELGETV